MNKRKKMNIDNIELENTVLMTVDSASNTIKIDWKTIEVPKKYIEFEIYYVIDLFKDDEPIDSAQIKAYTSTIFKNIELKEDHLFSATVSASIHTKDFPIPIGEIQYGDTRIINGVIIPNIPQVQDVYASTNDEGELSVRWNAIEIEGISYTINICNEEQSTIYTENNISTNIISLPTSKTGIELDNTYTIYINGETQDSLGPESNAHIVTAGGQEQNPNFNKHSPNIGESINVASGHFSYQNIDFHFGNDSDLAFKTFYCTEYALQKRHTENINTDQSYLPPSVLGNGWSHNYMTSLVVKNDKSVIVYWGEGDKTVYKQKRRRTIIGQQWDGEYKITSHFDGSSLVYQKNRTRYILTKHDQTKYIFNRNGKLITIVSAIGNKIVLDYHNNLLSKVTDHKSSNYLLFNYDLELNKEDNNSTLPVISTVTDNYDRKIKYQVKNGKLDSYTDVLNEKRSFSYTSHFLIETIKDQNGDVFVYNEYKENKVIFQQDANAYKENPRDHNYGLFITYFTSTSTNWLKKKHTTSIIDNEGNKITIECNKNGSLLRKEIALENEKIALFTFKYDGFNNKIEETNFEGTKNNKNKKNTIANCYDGNLNLKKRFYKTGERNIPIEEYSYNKHNQITHFTNHLGNTTCYMYKNKCLTEILHPLGISEKYSYKKGEIKGLVKKHIDKIGNTFSFEYEGDKLTKITDPYRNETHIEYDQKSYDNPSKVEIIDKSDQLLKTTTYTYNKSGLRIKEAVQFKNQEEKDAFTTHFEYDKIGNIISETNAENNTTKFKYNPNLKLTEIEFPTIQGVSSSQVMKYDKNNNLIAIEKGGGFTEHFQYDAMNRVIKKTNPNGEEYCFEYEMGTSKLKGEIYNTTQRIVFPKLKGQQLFSESTTIDGFQRPIKTTNKSGQATFYNYIGHEELEITTHYPEAISGDHSSQYQSIKQYDAFNRLIASTDQEGNVSTFSYGVEQRRSKNKNVEVIVETNPLGIKKISHLNSNKQIILQHEGNEVSWYEYDALGRITKTDQIIDGNENVEVVYSYAYDKLWAAIKVESKQNGKIISSVFFNGINQLINQQNAQGINTSRIYNSKGDLITYQVEGGNKINYEYDKSGRMSKVFFSDKTNIVYEYDNNGNCICATQLNEQGDAISKQSKKFDRWNRIESITDLEGETISYQYNAENSLIQLTYPSMPNEGKVNVKYEYDNLQRMTKVIDWRKRETSYYYSAAGMLEKTIFPNETLSEYTFDDAQRLIGLKNTKDDLIISKSELTLDANGNLVKSKILQPLAGKVNSANNHYTYNRDNQLETNNGHEVSYNINGNPNSLPKTTNIKFNALNLMTEYGEDRYTYNVQGLRKSSTIDGEKYTYITNPNAYSPPYLSLLDPFNNEFDTHNLHNSSPLQPKPKDYQIPDQVLQITNEHGGLEKRFVYGLGLIAEEDATDEYHVYHFDERGSTLAMTDDEGSIVNRNAYSPYGERINQHGIVSTRFLYNGKYGVITDDNGLNSMRSRFYDPETMHFLQQDFLIGDSYNSQTLNRYAYAEGNPISFIDPLGLKRSSVTHKNLLGENSWLKWFLVGASKLSSIGGVGTFFYYQNKLKKAKLIMALNEEWLGRKLAKDYLLKNRIESTKSVAKWGMGFSTTLLNLGSTGFLIDDATS